MSGFEVIVDKARDQLGQLGGQFTKGMFRMDEFGRRNIYFDLRDRLEMQVPLSQALLEQWNNASDDGDAPRRVAALALASWRKAVVDENKKLADAMEGWVPARDLMLIRAGETTGRLPAAFAALMDLDGLAARIQAAIFKACGYPLGVIGLMGAVLYSFGAGLFQGIREDGSASKVSADMQNLMAMSQFVMDWGVAFLLCLMAVAACCAASMPYLTGKVRQRLDRIPPWSLYKLWQEVYFLLALAALLKAMVTSRVAMEKLMEGVTPYLSERLREIWKGVKGGKEVGSGMFLSKYNFPPKDVSRNIRGLEERGDIGEVVDRKTRVWIEEKARRMERISKWILWGGLLINGLFIVYVFTALYGLSDVADDFGG